MDSNSSTDLTQQGGKLQQDKSQQAEQSYQATQTQQASTQDATPSQVDSCASAAHKSAVTKDSTSKSKSKSKRNQVNYAELLASFKASCAEESERARKAKAARDANPNLTSDHKIHYIEDLEAQLQNMQPGAFPENWHIDMLEQLDNLVGSEERMVMAQGGYDEGWYWDNDLHLSPEKEIQLATLLSSSTLPYAKVYIAKRAKLFLEYKERQRKLAAGELTEEDLAQEDSVVLDPYENEFCHYGYREWDLNYVAWPCDRLHIDYGLVYDMTLAAVTAHVDTFYLRKVIDGKDMFLNWLDTADFIGIVPTQGFKLDKAGRFIFCTSSAQLSLIGCKYTLIDTITLRQNSLERAYPSVKATLDKSIWEGAKQSLHAQESNAFVLEGKPHNFYHVPLLLRHVSWQWPYTHAYARDVDYALASCPQLEFNGMNLEHEAYLAALASLFLEGKAEKLSLHKSGRSLVHASGEKATVLAQSLATANGHNQVQRQAKREFHVMAQADTFGPQETTFADLTTQLFALFAGREAKISSYEDLRQVFLICTKDLSCVLDTVSERLLYKYCRVVSADNSSFYLSLCFNAQGVITKVTSEQSTYKSLACLKRLSVLVGFKIAAKFEREVEIRGDASEQDSLLAGQGARGECKANAPDLQQVLQEARTLVQTQEQLDNIVANYIAAKQAQQEDKERQDQAKDYQKLSQGEDSTASANNVALLSNEQSAKDSESTEALEFAESESTGEAEAADTMGSLNTRANPEITENTEPPVSSSLNDIHTPKVAQNTSPKLNPQEQFPEFADASLLLQAQRIKENDPSWPYFGRIEIPDNLMTMHPEVVNHTVRFVNLVQELLHKFGVRLVSVEERRNQKRCLLQSDLDIKFELVINYVRSGKITKVTCKAQPLIGEDLGKVLVGRYLVEDLEGFCVVKPFNVDKLEISQILG